MKRISKKLREEAALLCALMASNRQSDGRPVTDFEPACNAVGVDCFEDDGAADLAREAYWSIPKYVTPATRFPLSQERMRALIEDVRANSSVYWAEAESLLRTGWCPP